MTIVENDPGGGDERRTSVERSTRTLPKAISLEHVCTSRAQIRILRIAPLIKWRTCGRCGYHPVIIPAFPVPKQRVHVERTQSVKTGTWGWGRLAARRGDVGRSGNCQMPIGENGEISGNALPRWSTPINTADRRPAPPASAVSMGLMRGRASRVASTSMDIGEREMDLARKIDARRDTCRPA